MRWAGLANQAQAQQNGKRSCTPPYLRITLYKVAKGWRQGANMCDRRGAWIAKSNRHFYLDFSSPGRAADKAYGRKAVAIINVIVITFTTDRPTNSCRFRYLVVRF